ncbi:16S rRNA (adenine(1518)-N(6)/adenine(1519)-N(6))-dimethyltransferase RsmA [bacterium]|nr:16S rRNA (adenine(1518)-N(6)/adenine(1519)-N(6))-dimethyltransferase RsmA [bacterium]
MNALTFRPKKSLGQNFLVDENIARKIIDVVTPKPEDVIVEIGPGFGVLTKYLVPKVGRLIAVEIDRELAKELSETYSHHQNFELIHADFLKTDLSELARGSTKLRVVGNIPYHITSPVIFKTFEDREIVHDLTLMIQREVAQRIVALPGKRDYGILSVLSQLYSEPRIAFSVSRHVFRPKPDVDSAIVRWNFGKMGDPLIKDPVMFRKIIHTVFQQRRKMLRSSLRSDPTLAQRVLSLDFDLKRRPEDLDPSEFVTLANQVCK